MSLSPDIDIYMANYSLGLVKVNFTQKTVSLVAQCENVENLLNILLSPIDHKAFMQIVKIQNV